MGLTAGPMFALRQSLFRHRHLAMLALALAFVLRALIPQGMMAAPDAAHGITVLLCDGTGVAGHVAVPLGENHGKTQPAQSCPYAVLGQAGMADEAANWTVPQLAAPQLILQRAPEATQSKQNQRVEPPARAPPVRV